MMDDPGTDITQLLLEWSHGNHEVLDQLTSAIYKELRARARAYLQRERSDHTLQPTALIHETYLRLINQNVPEWQSRVHFFAVASHVMRQVLVDHARKKNAARRGSGSRKISLEDAGLISNSRSIDLLALDEALRELSAFDERKSRIIEMRYFGGCTIEETAEALGVAPITVLRESRLAEAWLRRALTGSAGASGSS